MNAIDLPQTVGESGDNGFMAALVASVFPSGPELDLINSASSGAPIAIDSLLASSQDVENFFKTANIDTASIGPADMRALAERANGTRNYKAGALLAGLAVLTADQPLDGLHHLALSLFEMGDLQQSANCYAALLGVGGAITPHMAWHAATIGLAAGREDLANLAFDKLNSGYPAADPRFEPVATLGRVWRAPISDEDAADLAQRSLEESGLAGWIVDRVRRAFEGALALSSANIEKRIALFEYGERLGLCTMPVFELDEHFGALKQPDAKRKFISKHLGNETFLLSQPVLNFVSDIDRSEDRKPATALFLALVNLRLRRGSDVIRVLAESDALDASAQRAIIDAASALPPLTRYDILTAIVREGKATPELALSAVEAALVSGRPDVALQFLDRIDGVPDTHASQGEWLKACTYLLLNDIDRAAPALKRAVDHAPDNARRVSALAHGLFAQKDMAGVLAALARARDAGGRLDDASLLLECLALRVLCRFGEAANAAWALADTSKDPAVIARAHTMGMFCAQLAADADLRAEAARRVLTKMPDPRRAEWDSLLFNIVLFSNLGLSELLDGATKALLDRGQQSAIAQLWRVLSFAVDGRWNEVLTQLKDKDLSGQIALEAKFLRGIALKSTWNLDAAEREFAELRRDPSAPPIDDQIGHLALLRGDVETATALFQAAALRHAPPEQPPQKATLRDLMASALGTERGGQNAIGRINFWPMITVQVSNFNDARFLPDALNSIWVQAYPFWECLIVDDGSSDESMAIAEAYVAADSRFRIIRHDRNKGLAAARNSGLEQAKGQYITFLDSDDFFSISANSSRYFQLRMEADPRVAGSYCGIRQVPEMDCSRVPVDLPALASPPKNLISTGFQSPFNAHAPLVRTSVLREVGGFDESLMHGAEDWNCWARAMRSGYSFVATGRVAGYYRRKRGSMVRSMSAKHVNASRSIIKMLSTRDDADNVVFKRPLSHYSVMVPMARRALQFAAMAYMAGDHAGFDEIVASCPLAPAELKAAVPDVGTIVREGVERFYADAEGKIDTFSRSAFMAVRAQEITDAFLLGLEQLPSGDKQDAPSLLEVEDGGEDMQIERPANAHVSSFGASGRSRLASLAQEMGLEEQLTQLATPDKIRRWKNKFSDQRCFIVGNGPSLNQTNLGKLANEKSFAVNGIFYKTEQMGYRPNFFVVEDSSVLNENLDKIRAYETEAKFFPTIYHRLVGEADNTNYFVMNRGFYEPRSSNYRIPRFSSDAAGRLYTGQSVTYINLQLAFYMGFSEVYLVGMDFSYIVPEDFDRRGDLIASTGDDPNHFHPDYFGKGKTWKNPKLDRVLANYQMAKLAYEGAGRRIFNATVGGKLELFPRVDFDSLF